MAGSGTQRCPVCGRPVRAGRLDGHLRKAHPAPGPAPRRAATRAFRLPRRERLIAAAVVAMVVSAGVAFYIVRNRLVPSEDLPPGPMTDTRTIPTAYVSMETESGGFLLALYGNATPLTVRQFLGLAAGDFYNGTIFHIAVKGQLIAGGGYLTNLSQKLLAIDPKTGRIPSIPLEINPVMKNTAGTIGMLHNATDPDTAVTEFYINLADNPSLDKGPGSPGFSVFGRLLSGMEVAAGIGNLTVSDQRTPGGLTLVNVPVEHVKIQRVAILTADG